MTAKHNVQRWREGSHSVRATHLFKGFLGRHLASNSWRIPSFSADLCPLLYDLC